MSTQSQFEVNQQLSLYIPHVFPNFTSEYIKQVFEFMEFGEVDHIDLVAKMDKYGKPYNAAYIHFSEWFTGPVSENFQDRVLDPNREARIIHDDPWYWIVLENTAKKYVPGDRKECIDLSESIENATEPVLGELQNCDIDDPVYQENVRLSIRISRHLAHVNECHKTIAALCLEKYKLTEQIDSTNCEVEDIRHHLENIENDYVTLEIAYQDLALEYQNLKH